MAEKRLYVRGFGHNISKEELEIHFQRRKTSGGGDIESIDFKEDEAIITFEDKEVAKNVSQRSHAIKGTQIDVSSEPFKEESHEASGLQSRTVNIRGLSKDTTQDALQNYLENTRRSGGGEVEEMSITGDSASVKFQLPGVAKRVVEREHSLNGVKLQMTLEAERDSPEEEPRTVEVSGLAACTTEDSIVNYFENTRRSGGGEIKHVQFNPDMGVALVTFSTAEKAKAVLHRDKHTLDGAVLNVALKRLNVSGHGSSPEEEISQSRTIEISGLAPLTTEDSITNYFENTRRSGGGDIESVEFKVEIGMAVVTFKTAESARDVANKKRHTLDKAELKVVLRRPVKKPPLDSKRLLVKGLSEKTAKDGLESYMEIASKVEVSSVELKGQGRALVTFSDTPDLKAINDRLLKRPLDGESLSIEQVPVCHCVMVTGLNNETTTEDAIRYHFENPKKGGGEVNNVKFNVKEGWAIVSFEQPRVVTTVLAKSHTLNGAHLQLRPYNTFLEESIPHADSEDIGIEAPIDPDVMLFIYERWGAEIQQIQNDQGVKINWQTGSNKITLKPLNKTKTNKKQWDNACSAVTAFTCSFIKRTVSIIPEAWQAVLQKTKDDYRSTQNKVKVDALPQDHAIVLTGQRGDVEGLAKDLEALKADIERKTNLESSKRTVVIKTIPGKTLQLLKQHGFAQELQDRYKDVQIDIFPDKLEVSIRGPEDTLFKATAVMWQAVASIREDKLEVSENVAGVLRREAGRAFIQDKFKCNGVQAVLRFESDGKKNFVVLMARNADFAYKASVLVNRLFTEESVVLDENQVHLEKTDKWRRLRDDLTENHVINISFDGRNRTLWIAGSTKDTLAALESVKRFFKENTIVSNAPKLPRDKGQPLGTYQQNDLQEIQREYQVKGRGTWKLFSSIAPSASSEGSSSSIVTQKGMKLTLVAGDISREQVDAIVNTVSTDLNLSNNPSAKALSVAAGPKLQQECSAVGKVTTGDIVITTGGNLKCKHVFHTSCVRWENGKGEQVLRGIVHKCLGEAQKRNLSSIAIPAIGTGNLGFPRDRVAKACFDEAVSFSQNNSGSVLKDVRFVVFDKDTPSVQAFQMELQARKLTSPKRPESSGKTKRLVDPFKPAIILGIPLPEHWDAQPKDGSGAERDVHLVTLDPTKDAEEYKKVVDELGRTAGITVSKIERVQNPALYRAYVVRREHMDQKKGSNENLLFHGTAGTSCPNINHYGFNRSYCGKNAMAYGIGVYFARDASYSLQTRYSPPDGSGNRYLYLARVLVGEYTTGRQGLIAPPTKGSVATNAYDTVVDNMSNPRVFVAFYDNQCYPDYLITFKQGSCRYRKIPW